MAINISLTLPPTKQPQFPFLPSLTNSSSRMHSHDKLSFSHSIPKLSYFTSRNGFSVNSSSPSPSAVDSQQIGGNSEAQVQTSHWNWRSYSVRYQYCGNTGPALVLVHGFGANSDHWRKNIPVLAKSHRVFAIDLIGYGYSEKPNPRKFGDASFYTFETWGDQLNDFCVDVVKDRAFFICNSIGGNCLLAALDG